MSLVRDGLVLYMRVNKVLRKYKQELAENEKEDLLDKEIDQYGNAYCGSIVHGCSLMTIVILTIMLLYCVVLLQSCKCW